MHVRLALALSSLLLAACEKEKDDPLRNAASRSSRAANPSAEKDAARRARLAAADKDEGIKQLREKIRTEPPGPNPGWGWTTNLYKVATRDLAVLYATKHPEAGIAWLLTLEGDESRFAWDTFGEALYQQDPQAAFSLLETLDQTGREDYAIALASAVRGDDLNRMWALVLNSDTPFGDRTALKKHLVASEARADPQQAWETAQTRLGPDFEQISFIFNMTSLDPEVPFPVGILNATPHGQQQAVLVESAIQKCRSEASLAPVSALLEAHPPEPTYDMANAAVAQWHSQYGDSDVARRFSERITDPAIRAKSLSSVESMAKFRKYSVVEDIRW